MSKKWSFRIEKFRDNPRAIVPFLKKRLYYNFIADHCIPAYQVFRFLGYNETIEYAIREGTSIIRFGDELFDMIAGIGLYYGDWRQRWHKEIAMTYKEIIASRDSRILLCFNANLIMKDRKQFKAEGIADQWHFWTNAKVFLKDYLHPGQIYGAGHCFQPQYNTQLDFKALKDFFATKHIIIVAAKPERFRHIALGKTTNFISAPQSDAWDSYDAIKAATLEVIAVNQYPKQDVLILGSASVASKILIYELTIEHDIRGWDTGQFFDLAYEAIQKMGA